MLVTYVRIPSKIDNSFLEDLEEKYKNYNFNLIKRFYKEYCEKDYKYQKKDFDISKMEKEEVFLVGNEEDIYIRRYIKKLYYYGINSLIFPHIFCEKAVDYGEGFFNIKLEDETIIGCAENMRYVNRKVYHRQHLVLLTLKLIGGL